MEPIPGPCSVTVGLSASGFPSEAYVFGGYLSKTIGEKLDQLGEIRNMNRTCVLFESPNRLIKTLDAIAQVFGSKHHVFVAFELTKRHETHYRGTIEQILEQLSDQAEGSRLKGEVTMVLAPSSTSEELEIQDLIKGSGFDPKKDSMQKVNAI